MKRIFSSICRIGLMLCLGFLGLVVLTNCKKAAPPAATAPSATQWYCPMHPSYISDKPGECPICHMTLVSKSASPMEEEKKTDSVGKRKVLYYRSPMNPAQTSPVPRKDEMGMDYLPVYEDNQSYKEGPPGFAPIVLTSSQQQLINVKTAFVKRAPLAGALRTVGRIVSDETRVYQVRTRYEAYVEKLYADFTGKFVRKGDPLLSLYSPEVFAAEQEYLVASQNQRGGNMALEKAGVDLTQAARQKLLLLNVPSAEIRALEKRGKPNRTFVLYAPRTGYLLSKKAFPGMRAVPEETLFEIVDLSHIWVMADLYESEVPRVHLGESATVTLPYFPDRRFQGKIHYISPTVDPKTRTVQVRLELENPKGELKVDMLANVEFHIAPREAVVIPEDAVIETGVRQVVFVALKEGRFQPREIATGERDNHLYEVLRGLKDGEQVATGAAFLLDSESRLRAVVSKGDSPTESTPPKQTEPSPHHTGGHHD